MNEASKAICQAWTEKKPEILKEILAENFKWFESPFEEPIEDVDYLISVWSEHLDLQNDIQVSFEVLYEDSSHQVTKCDAKISRYGERQNLSGVYAISFDKAGKVKEFRHWWEKQ